MDPTIYPEPQPLQRPIPEPRQKPLPEPRQKPLPEPLIPERVSAQPESFKESSAEDDLRKLAAWARGCVMANLTKSDSVSFQISM